MFRFENRRGLCRKGKKKKKNLHLLFFIFFLDFNERETHYLRSNDSSRTPCDAESVWRILFLELRSDCRQTAPEAAKKG
jgi:hypothetical protein